MRRLSLVAVTLVLGLTLSQSAHAVVCAAGVYRAGCVGPNGGAVVRRPYGYHYGYGGHRACAAGPYRAGCVGPNGAVVHRRW